MIYKVIIRASQINDPRLTCWNKNEFSVLLVHTGGCLAHGLVYVRI